MAETLVPYAHTPMVDHGKAGKTLVRHVICVPCQRAWPAARAGEAVDHDVVVHGGGVPDYPPA